MARLDPGETFEALKGEVTKAIKSQFPQVGSQHVLELRDVVVDDNVSSDEVSTQAAAKLDGKTFGVPIKASLVLRDKASGKVLDERVQRVGTLPKITSRYSWIVRGTEYQVDNQFRLRPGVYTTVHKDGGLESFLNFEGIPLHIKFDPKSKKFAVKHKTASPPLYPVMRALGFSDEQLRDAWGKEILAANQVDTSGRPLQVDKRAMDFARKLVPAAEVNTLAEASRAIKTYLGAKTLHPDVTEKTLGARYDTITPDVFRASTERLLGIARGEQKPDTRDALHFKELNGVEDLLSERLAKNAKMNARRIANNLDKKTEIRQIVGTGHFNSQLHGFFADSTLASLAQQTNPLRMIDGHTRTTIMGEGGIKSANAVTDEAKLVDPSHFGVLDPLVTPESGKAGVSLQLAIGAKKDGKTLAVPLINVKTGKVEFVNTAKVNDVVVAMPDAVTFSQGKLVAKDGGSTVRASVKDNEFREVPLREVQYVAPKATQMFSLSSNLVPFLASNSPNRASMSGRHQEQAISLKYREPPLVRSALGDKSFGEILGQFAAQHSPVSGEVVAVEPGLMKIKGPDGVKEVQLYNHYPLNDKKGQLHSTPSVKVGDKVKAGQLIADTNFSADGIYAPGKNLQVAYLPWGGQSVSGDTYVYWVDSQGGHFGPIGNMPAQGEVYANVLDSESVEGRLHRVHSFIGHYTAEPMFEIKMLEPFRVKATACHSFITIDETGGFVNITPAKMIPRKTLLPVVQPTLRFSSQIGQMFCKSKTAGGISVSFPMDKDAGYVFGVYTAEGCSLGGTRGCKGLSISVTEGDLLERLESILDKWGVSHSRRLRGVNIHNSAVGRIVTDACGCLAQFKKIPDLLWSQHPDFIDGFLDGYWSGDGTCSDKQFTASTVSRELAEGLIFLLAARGVKARYRTYKIPGHQDQNLINVYRETLDKFPALSSGRKELLRQELIAKGTEHGRDRIPIPEAYRDEVKKALRSVGRALGGSPYAARRVLKQVRELLPETVRRFVDAPIWWEVVDTVKEVEPEEYVYDLDMRPFGNFIVGPGLVVHNTYEDGVVISEDAAQKLTSTHLYKSKLSTRDARVEPAKRYKSIFGATIPAERMAGLGEDGVVREGTMVKPGDVLVAGSADRVFTTEEQKLRAIQKSLVPTKRNAAVTWDAEHPGKVVAVHRGKSGVEVHVETEEPAQVGDKISSHHAAKGIISAVLPSAEMPQRPDGSPIDIVMNPVGTAGRLNVGQILETAAAKVAEKTGKPFIIKNFETEDNHGLVAKALKEHGLSDTENLIDPTTGNTIPGILTGPQYIIKLEHQVDKKMSSRDRGAYDRNLIPKGGGHDGGQAFGALGTYALLSHGARGKIQEAQTLLSDKGQGGLNDELWGAIQSGELIPPPKATFATKKFEGYLRGLGVNVEQDGNRLSLMPVTDAQTLALSSGELQDAGRTVIVKNNQLVPEKGGLFDKRATGGLDGQKWGHITLAKPMPNPLFESGIRSLTGLKTTEYQQLISGELGVSQSGALVPADTRGAETGPSAVVKLLDKVDVKRALQEEEGRIGGLRGQKQNEVRKKIKYLRALDRLKLSPADAYTTRHVPILPPSMRPVALTEDGKLQNDDLNYLYRDLAVLNDQVKKIPADMPKSLVQDKEAYLYDSLRALTGLGGTVNDKYPGLLHRIAGKTSPKQGFFQNVLMKRKQDLSGRSTIIPDPTLSLDEVGLPIDMARVIYKPFVVREMKNSLGLSPLAAKKLIDEDDPLARKALERVVSERPIMLKRDPALHKHSVQGFKPKLIKGSAIKIPPLVTSGFNADFDGDQCIGAVVLFLERDVFNYDICYWTPRRITLTARMREQIGYCDADGEFVVCDLSEVPHAEECVTKGHIDYHPVSGVSVLTLDPTKGACFAEVTGWSYHRQRSVEIVTLASGRQIVTDDDPRAVFGVDASSLEWCRRRPRESADQFVPVLDEVPASFTELTALALPRDKSGRMKPEVLLDAKFGYFLGCLVGDGWVTGDETLRFTCMASSFPEVLGTWERSASCLFSENPHFSEQYCCEGTFENSKGTTRATISSVALATFLQPLIGHGARNKHLPPFFLSAPESFRVGLLAGLMDTDGSMSWSMAKGKAQFMCSVSSTSIRLLQETQHLLRTLGITASITTTTTPKGAASWVLSISSVGLYEHRRKLARPAHSGKRAVWEEFCAGDGPASGGAFSRYRLVPLPSKLAASLRKIVTVNEDRSVYMTLSKAIDRQYMSKLLAEKTVRMVNERGGCAHPFYARWARLVETPGMHFERVVDVQQTNILEDGYDLTVPGYETFMAVDGVVLSNTMSAYVPVTEKAVQEAWQMMPSNNLFSPASGKLMYAPTNEMQVGLYMATEVGKDTDKKFASLSELRRAVNSGKLHGTDVVTLNGQRTTFHRAELVDALPEQAREGNKHLLTDLGYRLTKAKQGALFESMAHSGADGKEFGAAINAVKDLGNKVVSTGGFSFGLKDIAPQKALRAAAFADADKAVAQLRGVEREEKIVDLYSKATTALEKDVQQMAQERASESALAKLQVAAGIKGNGYRQLVAAPGLFVDGLGRVVPSPVKRSYAEGLKSSDYYVSTSGARKGIIQKVQSVRDPGYLTKLMVNSTISEMVDREDCGTHYGISLSVDEPDVQGRFTVVDHKLSNGSVIPAGTLLDSSIVTRIRNDKPGAKLVVRSPMRCTHTTGLCAKCAGLQADGKLPEKGTNIGILAAQALGERGTQLALKSFHCSHAKTLVVVCRRDDQTVRAMTLEELYEKAVNPVAEGWLIYDGAWQELSAVSRHRPTDRMMFVSCSSVATVCQDNHPLATYENRVSCEKCGYHRLKKPGANASIKNGKLYCPKCFTYQYPMVPAEGEVKFLAPQEVECKRVYLQRCLDLPVSCVRKTPWLDPYLAGMYVAEGSLGYVATASGVKKPYFVTISQNRGAVRDKLEQKLPPEWCAKLGGRGVVINRVALGERLETTFGRYSRNVALPSDFLAYEQGWLAEFLCGLIDGDGTIKPDKDGAQRIAIDTTSFALAQQVVFICSLLNIVPSVLATSHRKLTRHQGFRVVLRVTAAVKDLLKESIKVQSVEKLSPDQDFQRTGRTLLSTKKEVLYTDEYVYDVTTSSGTFLAGGVLSHNSGGVYSPTDMTSLAGSGIERAMTLLQLPKTVKGSATLSTVGGVVRKVERDAAGGVNIFVDDGKGLRKHYVPAGRKLLGSVGGKVRPGDPLSSGPVNPHDLLPLAGVARTQGFLANELHSIYGKEGVRRRHSEVLVRAVSSVARVEDPGDHATLLPGDYVDTNATAQWNDKHRGKAPVQYTPVVRGVEQLPLDVSEDWLARLNHERGRKTIIEAAQQNWSTDLHGRHPIPGLIYGVEFGKGTKDKPWHY
jgi:DNA-directed RNA polymerase beta subunit/DNA-directed RNA polymerase beta' subunit